MEGFDISIIVPVYNTEKYLHRCVDSILAQTFTDFELLLIDDGSKDNSGKICDEYAAKDNRIRVFHKENGGVSSARNLGLDNACGKYIIFMDADDYWYDATALEQLYVTAETYDLDIIRGEYKAVDSNGNLLFERPIPDRKMELSNKVLNASTFYTNIICRENFLVLSLIKRDTISNLRFSINRVFLEDMEFYARLFLKQLRCMFVPIRFYAYRKLSESASNTPKVKNLEDSFSMCDVFDKCSEETQDADMKRAFRYNSVMMYYWTLETLCLDIYYKDRNEIIRDLRLVDLQRKISYWGKKDNHVNYPFLIYVAPKIGVYLFKYYLDSKLMLYRLYMCAKKLFNKNS